MLRLPPGATPTSRRPPRNDIEHRRIFGHPDRQFQRQGDDGGPQPDARGPRSDLRQEDEGRRQATLGFMEMVLSNPDRIESQALGTDDLLGGQAIALGRGRLIEQAREESQALSWLCWWHPHIFAQTEYRHQTPNLHKGQCIRASSWGQLNGVAEGALLPSSLSRNSAQGSSPAEVSSPKQPLACQTGSTPGLASIADIDGSKCQRRLWPIMQSSRLCKV